MHSFIATFLVAPLFVNSVTSLPSSPLGGWWYVPSNSYHTWNASSGGSSQERANAVKLAFETAWDGYYEYAFPNDELLPVNNSFGNSR